MANRGITMAASATRRAPNAFNLIRQVEVLQRAGHGSVTQQFKEAICNFQSTSFIFCWALISLSPERPLAAPANSCPPFVPETCWGPIGLF